MEILLIEDNEADVVLMEEALREIAAEVELSVANSGEEGLEFLRKSSPKPDLVVLDLNLPGKHGTEVLAEIKADESMRRIPVIVLSSSGDAGDVKSVYDRNGNCFVRKPGEFDEFLVVVERMEKFWLQTAFLSPQED